VSEKVLYIELMPHEFKERVSKAPIAYLPLGTLEWHGYHMPLGVDGLISMGFFKELAKKVGGIVLPMLFLGPDNVEVINNEEYYGMDIHSYPSKKPQQLPGSAYWVENELFKKILESIVKLLKRAGFKIVVAHGHSPSTIIFIKNSKQWMEKYNLELLTCWREKERDDYGIQTDHAAANETSLMMALRNDLVNLNNLPENRDEKPLGLLGKDPRQFATGDIGRKIINMQLERMVKILEEKLKQI
jgi:creatinine amidohydrolase